MEIDGFVSLEQGCHEKFFQCERKCTTDDSHADIDERSAHALMLNYQAFLRGRCRILLRGNRDEANDLFSQVMLKVCTEQPSRLRHIQHLGGWLNRIAYNQFIDDQRERQAQERRDENLCYLYQTIEHQARSPEQEFLNNELDRHIRLAFQSLPERLRRAAHLRFYEGAPYEEIAADLAISQANARKRIQEARKILAASLRIYTDEPLRPNRGRPCVQVVIGELASPDTE